MYKKLIVTIFFLTFCQISMAQDTVTVWGEIGLENNKVQNILPHITIELQAFNGSVVKVLNSTNVARDPALEYSRGRFYFHNIPEGTYQLRVSSQKLPRSNSWQGTFRFNRVSGVTRLLAGADGRRAEGYTGKFEMSASGYISYSNR